MSEAYDNLMVLALHLVRKKDTEGLRLLKVATASLRKGSTDLLSLVKEITSVSSMVER